jgi:hypothetical protein
MIVHENLILSDRISRWAGSVTVTNGRSSFSSETGTVSDVFRTAIDGVITPSESILSFDVPVVPGSRFAKLVLNFGDFGGMIV